MSKVLCELSEDGKRIEVWFRYDIELVKAVKTVAGSGFVSKEKSYNGVPYWKAPRDMATCRALRRAFGTELTIGEALKSWATEQVRKESALKSIATAETAVLQSLPTKLPKLYEAIHLGPLGRFMTPEERATGLAGPASFQAADVRFLAISDNPLNANHPGLGKTLETIGAVYEAGLEDGPKLVVCPKSAMEATWAPELEDWQDQPAWVSTGTAAAKANAIHSFEKHIASGGSGWLIVNPDQVRFRESYHLCEYHYTVKLDAPTKKAAKQCPDCKVEMVSEFPALHSLGWSVVIIDECHKNAVRNPTTLTAKGMFALDARKRFALSGTPMGGKIMNLFGILKYLNPKVFSSKWRFADQWTDISDNGYGKTIGDSIRHCQRHRNVSDELSGRPECAECRAIEEAFYTMLTPYVIRRTKAEALPWLPAKDFIPVWCDFGSTKHANQYKLFEAESFASLDGEDVTASNVLTEYLRLKQFSFGVHERRGDKLVPTLDSGKLIAMQEKLEELGIWDGSSDEQVVIASQFSEVVDLVTDWLNVNGVPAAKITGAVSKSSERAKLREDFQGSTYRAMVMTTTAGGVAITLDRASNVFVLDETWDPDDQEQLEDRCHRASRIHQVTVYYFRTKGTIEEDIAAVTGTKKARNVRVLDARRLRDQVREVAA